MVRSGAQAGLDAFLCKAEERSQEFLTAYRGRVAGDPEVRAIVEEGRRRQAAAVLAAIGSGHHALRLLRVALRGWIALVQDVTAQWLEDRRPPRERVRDMLVGALKGAIAAAADVESDVDAAIRL
jgi:hypothetical protein